MIWKTTHHKENGNILNNIPLFAELDDAETEQIEHIIIKKKFSRDQIVLFEEDTARYMYIVYAGKVRVVKQSREGREQIIAMHKKYDYFGEMSLLDGRTAPATVIAHEASVIGLISKDDFEQHLISNLRIRNKIIDLLCAQLRDSWAMIKILSFDNAEQRVIAVFARMKELYGVADDRGWIINFKLTHHQIANYASLTRETVTRMLKKLETDGVIQVQENRLILLQKLFFERLNNMP
ncbi:MAG: Crp/Fnr family transcriptional regulator [Geobacteraceae bacterium]